MKYTKEDIKKFYHKEGLNPQSHQVYVYSEAKPLSQARMEMVKRCLEQYSSGVHRFLEVGCAEGFYCEFMSTRVPMVTGLDISEPKILRARMRPNIQYVVGDWDNMTFSDDSFDLVLASECLEHSLDPVATIKELFRVGKNLIISVPLEDRLITNPLENGSGHLHIFTISGVVKLFENYKFNDYEVHPTGKFMSAYINRE